MVLYLIYDEQEANFSSESCCDEYEERRVVVVS